MKNFKLTEEQRAIMLNYLQERPYKEVVQGINMLLNLEEIMVNGEVIAEVVPEESLKK